MNDFVTLTHIKNARAMLKSEGCLFLEQAYDGSACDEITAWMDSYSPDDHTEFNYNGTEMRIWDSHKKQRLVARFWEQCNVFMSCLLSADTEAFTMLSIRNRPIDRTDDAVQFGRWHTDSFRTQYKIFLFLNDVDDSNGPFEFIPGTHDALFKVKMVATGRYFSPKDFLGGDRGYSRLEDAWVDKVLIARKRPVTALCSAGTVMIVDTSAIHRARPCIEGVRYALTAYFR